MTLLNAQAEFGTQGDFEKLRTTEATTVNPDEASLVLIDSMSNVTPPSKQPVFRTPPLGRVIQVNERVRYQPFTLNFNTDTWEPRLVAMSGRDETGPDDEAPAFKTVGLLRDATGKRSKRMGYYTVGEFYATPQQLTRDGGGGLVVAQQCIIAGAWELTVSDDPDTTPSDLDFGPGDAQIAKCLWYIDGRTGREWSNGREVTSRIANLLGLSTS